MSAYLQRGNAGLPWLVASYQQSLSTEDSNAFLSTVCRTLLDRLTPSGWAAAGNFIADSLACGDFPSLVLYDPDVLDLGAADQSIIRQCLAFFSKRRDIDIGVDREATAREKFRAAEAACAVTNECFRGWKRGVFVFSPFVEAVLHRSQRKISDLLERSGLLDPSLSDFRPRFGPGASTQVPKKNACPVVKLGNTPACSTNLEDAAPALLAQWGSSELRDESTEVDLPVHFGKLSFVPKNAKTERAIVTEPALNGAWQLGIGDQLARCLRRAGIDLRDQSANQRAARYGSISGALATLDLSSASDTIAIGLVEHLFPEQWFDLLMRFRTEAVVDKHDGVIRLEKISSMGNGFTFPLESMIFWALASSVVDLSSCERRRVWVYGDDIIVDSKAAAALATVLSSLGFTLNPAKSFWSGSFRESCGVDFVFGTNVRPVYLDDALTGADFFRLHNAFVERRDFDIAKRFESSIHPSIRTRGPKGYGDGHLHDKAYISRPVSKKGYGGFTFETWASSARSLDRRIRRQLVERENGPDITYRGTAFARILALATYTTYLREEPVARDHPYYHEFPWQPAERRDVDHLVVPGGGTYRRMKVYTFEPAFA